jgi:hypothetical protein
VAGWIAFLLAGRSLLGGCSPCVASAVFPGPWLLAFVEVLRFDFAVAVFRFDALFLAISPLRGCGKIGTGTFATTDFPRFSRFPLGAPSRFSQPLPLQPCRLRWERRHFNTVDDSVKLSSCTHLSPELTNANQPNGTNRLTTWPIGTARIGLIG